MATCSRAATSTRHHKQVDGSSWTRFTVTAMISRKFYLRHSLAVFTTVFISAALRAATLARLWMVTFLLFVGVLTSRT